MYIPHNNYISKGLHGGYSSRVKISLYADKEQNIQCKCSFPKKDGVYKRELDIKRTKEKAFEDNKKVKKSLLKLDESENLK